MDKEVERFDRDREVERIANKYTASSPVGSVFLSKKMKAGIESGFFLESSGGPNTEWKDGKPLSISIITISLVFVAF